MTQSKLVLTDTYSKVYFRWTIVRKTQAKVILTDSLTSILTSGINLSIRTLEQLANMTSAGLETNLGLITSLFLD